MLVCLLCTFCNVLQESIVLEARIVSALCEALGCMVLIPSLWV